MASEALIDQLNDDGSGGRLSGSLTRSHNNPTLPRSQWCLFPKTRRHHRTCSRRNCKGKLKDIVIAILDLFAH